MDEFDWRQVRFRNRALMPAILINGPEDIVFSGDKRRAKGIQALRTFTNGQAIRNIVQPQSLSDSSIKQGVKHDCGCQDHTMDLEAEVRALKAQTTVLCELVENILENQPKSRNATMRSARTILSRIIGGQIVGRGDFPECVAIGNEMGFFCTGVLVHPKVVLTASHCTDIPITKVFLRGRQLSNPIEGEFRTVENVIVHPEYTQSQVPWNDITVLILSEPSTVEPVEIASMEEFIADDALTLVGFGNDSPDGQTGFGTKRRVNVGLTKTSDLGASELLGVQRRHGFDATREFHGGRVRSGQDSCNGDSGGPAYLNIPDDSNTGKFKVVGLTSRAANSSTVNCGDGGIYTLIPAYMSWLYEVTEGLIGTPQDTDTSDQTDSSTETNGLFISAVMPNPEGQDAGNEWIEITNGSNEIINLEGIILMDKQGGQMPLTGSLAKGETLRITIPEGHAIKLGNSGDSIKLIGEGSTLIHEVGYDKAHSGQEITFQAPVITGGDDDINEEDIEEDASNEDDCNCGNHDDCTKPINPNFTIGAIRC